MDFKLTPDQVEQALRVCFHPELRVNIVDLGLVDSIEVEQDSDAPGLEPRYGVSVSLLARTADDEGIASLTGQVHNRLLGMEQIYRARIQVVSDRFWTAARMSEAARKMVGLRLQSQQPLVNIKL